MEGSTFTWKIQNFSRMTTELRRSDTHVIGGHRWYIVVRPEDGGGSHHLGLFLGVADSESLPSGWSIFAKFTLVVLNQTTENLSVKKSTEHHFCAQVDDWGWDDFIVLSKLFDSSSGFLVRDTLVVKALVTVEPNTSIPVHSQTTMEANTPNPVQSRTVVGPNSPVSIKPLVVVEPESDSSLELKSQYVLDSPVAVKSHTALQDFDSLFDDIFKVVAASSSSLVPTGEADSGPTPVEISHSLSLLNHLADKSFSDIPFRLLSGLTSSLKVLAHATSLPSAQTSVIPTFCSEFEELCQSHVFNSARLETSKQFFDSMGDTLLLLKRYSKSQMRIKNSIDEISKETEQLERRLRELEVSKSRFFEDYAVIGKKAERAKAEWDEFTANEEDMTVQKKKAEAELAVIETKWTNFISLFKAEVEGVKSEPGELLARDEDVTIKDKEEVDKEVATKKTKWTSIVSLFRSEGVKDEEESDEQMEEEDEDMTGKKTRWFSFKSLLLG